MLLNRRGYATSVFCRQCGAHDRLPELQRVADRAHRPAATGVRAATTATSRASCPKQCVELRGAVPRARRLRHRAGRGGDLRALFPDARVGRVDRDTIRRRGSLTRAAAAASRRRELDVLVGTQMIAKGHDFPRVTLVGVISADVGLGLADFRAAERTFQLLTQVAGRAGRGEQRGRGDHPDAVSRALQHPARDVAGLRRVLRQGDRVPPRDALSAGGRDGQCRRARQDVTTRRWRRAADLARRDERAARASRTDS